MRGVRVPCTPPIKKRSFRMRVCVSARARKEDVGGTGGKCASVSSSCDSVVVAFVVGSGVRERDNIVKFIDSVLAAFYKLVFRPE